MKDLMQSSKLKAALWILGGVILLLLAFWFGTVVGYRRASFGLHFEENYYRNFYGRPAPYGFMGPMVGPAANMHGVAGEVIDVQTSTIAVRDVDGDEESVAVPSSTVIRAGDETITIGGIKIGDGIAVIGAPNGQGQIQARFIRIFPASSASSTSPAFPMPMPAPNGSF